MRWSSILELFVLIYYIVVDDLEVIDCTHWPTFLGSCGLFYRLKAIAWLKRLKNKNLVDNLTSGFNNVDHFTRMAFAVVSQVCSLSCTLKFLNHCPYESTAQTPISQAKPILVLSCMNIQLETCCVLKCTSDEKPLLHLAKGILLKVKTVTFNLDIFKHIQIK